MVVEKHALLLFDQFVGNSGCYVSHCVFPEQRIVLSNLVTIQGIWLTSV